MNRSIREAYLFGREHLVASGSEEAPIEAEVLLRHVLGLDRAGLYMRWEQSMPGEAWGAYQRLLEERATGRPVPYLTGHREFMGLSFAVDERAMIPRPETEILVEFVVDALRSRDLERSGSDLQPPPCNLQRQWVVVDVGTGSGCIAVSLAHLLPQAAVFAVDISPDALDVARANAARHGVDGRITFLEGDLLSPLPPELAGRVDAVVSNPPYVPQAQRDALPREIRTFEPPVALFADHDGTAVHRRLVGETPAWLAPFGLLALEVAAGQAEWVADVLRHDGRYVDVTVRPDYGGIPRVVSGTVPGGRPVRKGSVKMRAK